MESIILQLLPLLADEAVFSGSLPLLSRVGELASDLPAELRQAGSEEHKLLERCSDQFEYIKAATKQTLHTELLRTQSAGQKSQPDALERISKDPNSDPNVAFLAGETRDKMINAARATAEQLAASEIKYITTSGDHSWLPAHLLQVSQDYSLPLLVQKEAAERAKQYLEVHTMHSHIPNPNRANLPLCLDKVDALLTTNAQVNSPVGADTLQGARDVLKLARVAIKSITDRQVANALSQLEEKMAQGLSVELEQSAHAAYSRDELQAKQRTTLPGSTVDVNVLEQKIVRLEEIAKIQEQQCRAAGYQAQLTSILAAESQLAESMLGPGVVVVAARGLDSVEVATVQRLKIKLQASSAQNWKKKLMHALREADSVLAQSTLDEIATFYAQKSMPSNGGGDEADLQCGWVHPLEVIKIERVVSQFIKSAHVTEEMNDEEAKAAVKRGSQMLAKVLSQGADKATVDKAVEKALAPGKKWPGGRPPVSLLTEVARQLGTRKVGENGCSVGLQDYNTQADQLLNHARLIQRVFRAFKVKQTRQRRLEQGQDFNMRDSEQMFGTTRGTPSEILRDPQLAQDHGKVTREMNQRLSKQRREMRLMRQKVYDDEREQREDELRASVRPDVEDEHKYSKVCVCDEEPEHHHTMLNTAVLRLQHAGDRAGAQKRYDNLLDKHAQLQDKYKELESREHNSKMEAVKASKAQMVAEADLENAIAEHENLMAMSKAGYKLSDAQQRQMQADKESSYKIQFAELCKKQEIQCAEVTSYWEKKCDAFRVSELEATSQAEFQFDKNHRQELLIAQLKDQMERMLADHQSDIESFNINQEQRSLQQQQEFEHRLQELQDQLGAITSKLVDARNRGAAELAEEISTHQQAMHDLSTQLRAQSITGAEARDELQIRLTRQMEDQVRQVEVKYRKQLKAQEAIAKRAPWFKGKPEAPDVPEPQKLIAPATPLPEPSGAGGISDGSLGASPVPQTNTQDPCGLSALMHDLKSSLQQNEQALVQARMLRHAGQDTESVESPIGLGHPLLTALQATFVGIDKGMRDQIDVDVLCRSLIEEGGISGLDKYIDVQYVVETVSGLHLNQEFCVREFTFTQFCETLFMCQHLLLGDVPAKSELRWFHFQRSFASESQLSPSKYAAAQCVHPLSPPAWQWEQNGPQTGDGVQAVRENYYSKRSSGF